MKVQESFGRAQGRIGVREFLGRFQAFVHRPAWRKEARIGGHDKFIGCAHMKITKWTTRQLP